MRRVAGACGIVIAICLLMFGGLAGAGAAQDATPAGDCAVTSPEENTAVVEQWFAAWDAGDVAVFEEILAVDHIHGWAQGPDTISMAEFMARFEQFSSAFSGFTTTIDGVMAEGDIVAVRWTTTGTNDGSLFGMEPTGKTVSWTGINVFRFECGVIVESWSENDLFALMQQLGVPGIPATPTE